MVRPSLLWPAVVRARRRTYVSPFHPEVSRRTSDAGRVTLCTGRATENFFSYATCVLGCDATTNTDVQGRGPVTSAPWIRPPDIADVDFSVFTSAFEHVVPRPSQRLWERKRPGGFLGAFQVEGERAFFFFFSFEVCTSFVNRLFLLFLPFLVGLK